MSFLWNSQSIRVMRRTTLLLILCLIHLSLQEGNSPPVVLRIKVEVDESGMKVFNGSDEDGRHEAEEQLRDVTRILQPINVVVKLSSFNRTPDPKDVRSFVGYFKYMHKNRPARSHCEYDVYQRWTGMTFGDGILATQLSKEDLGLIQVLYVTPYPRMLRTHLIARSIITSLGLNGVNCTCPERLSRKCITDPGADMAKDSVNFPPCAPSVLAEKMKDRPWTRLPTKNCLSRPGDEESGSSGNMPHNDPTTSGLKFTTMLIIIISVTFLTVIVVIVVGTLCLLRRKKRKRFSTSQRSLMTVSPSKSAEKVVPVSHVSAVSGFGKGATSTFFA